jgi:hypothetical protein
VTELPLGTVKRVELAKVFAGKPRVVLLDEPFAGLSRAEARDRRPGSAPRGPAPLHQASGAGNCGLRFSRKAWAPSAMSGLPIDCTSMPSPVAKESRAAFHQTFELTLAISR